MAQSDSPPTAVYADVEYSGTADLSEDALSFSQSYGTDGTAITTAEVTSTYKVHLEWSGRGGGFLASGIEGQGPILQFENLSGKIAATRTGAGLKEIGQDCVGLLRPRAGFQHRAHRTLSKFAEDTPDVSVMAFDFPLSEQALESSSDVGLCAKVTDVGFNPESLFHLPKRDLLGSRYDDWRQAYYAEVPVADPGSPSSSSRDFDLVTPQFMLDNGTTVGVFEVHIHWKARELESEKSD